MANRYASAGIAEQLVVGLITVFCVATIGDHWDVPFRVTNFAFLAAVVFFAYWGASFRVCAALSAVATAILMYEFAPIPKYAMWSAASGAGFLVVSLIGSRLAVQAGKHHATPAGIAVAQFAGNVSMPVYGTDTSTRTLAERSAPMTDPPANDSGFDAAEQPFYEYMQRAKVVGIPKSVESLLLSGVIQPRVAVVIEDGQVEKIIAAHSKVDVLVIDLDAIKSLRDDTIAFETMEDMLTWQRIRANPEEMAALQDSVVSSFVDRGVRLG